MPNHFHAVLVFLDTGKPLPSLGTVVNWCKTAVTKAIRQVENDGIVQVWQSRYHEHVVRDERRLEQIREYIALNPGRWEDDEYHAATR